MSDISRTLFPHEAISIEEICTQVPEERRIFNFSDALVILQRLLTEDAIHAYIIKSYPSGEAIELQDKAALLEYHNIEPNVGCSINMLFDADSGDYNNAETLLHRIRNDDFLNTLRFSKNEVAVSFKDMALLMMPVVSNGENKVFLERKPGGSNIDQPRMDATELAIKPVFNDLERHLDLNGKIRVNDFCELVKESMESKGTAGEFHGAFCKTWARDNLGKRKLRVGEKLNPKIK